MYKFVIKAAFYPTGNLNSALFDARNNEKYTCFQIQRLKSKPIQSLTDIADIAQIYFRTKHFH
jgi:hypothetical protein